MKAFDEEKESLLTKMKHFLWWCAGADVAALKECPTDHAKFTAVGMMMLVVPCVAMVSFNFFVRQSFGAQAVAAAFGGVAWSALIFVLDRLILTFHRKGKREVLRAMPRLILSRWRWSSANLCCCGFFRVRSTWRCGVRGKRS